MASPSGGEAPSSGRGNFQVVWLQNKQGNTGKGGGLGDLLGRIWRGKERPGDAEGILVQRPSCAEALRKYTAEKGWVAHPCPLSNFLLGPDNPVVVCSRAWRAHGKHAVVCSHPGCAMTAWMRLHAALVVPYAQVWAAPLDPAKEHRGKNNVVATYLSAEMDGLARGTICGRALIACADGKDMTHSKVRRVPMPMLL